MPPSVVPDLTTKLPSIEEMRRAIPLQGIDLDDFCETFKDRVDKTATKLFIPRIRALCSCDMKRRWLTPFPGVSTQQFAVSKESAKTGEAMTSATSDDSSDSDADENDDAGAKDGHDVKAAAQAQGLSCYWELYLHRPAVQRFIGLAREAARLSE